MDSSLPVVADNTNHFATILICVDGKVYLYLHADTIPFICLSVRLNHPCIMRPLNVVLYHPVATYWSHDIKIMSRLCAPCMVYPSLYARVTLHEYVTYNGPMPYSHMMHVVVQLLSLARRAHSLDVVLAGLSCEFHETIGVPSCWHYRNSNILVFS